MRQITFDIVNAFEGRRAKKINNTETDGTRLWLHSNKIAEWRGDELWISNAGWFSRTTKERLNGLTGVHITQKNGNWYLNGNFWGGEWTSVNANNQSSSIEVEFDTSMQWSKDHSKPLYSVFHTNIEAELEAVETLLKRHNIPTRRMYSDTEGRYLPNHFIVVPVNKFGEAKSLIQ